MTVFRCAEIRKEVELTFFSLYGRLISRPAALPLLLVDLFLASLFVDGRNDNKSENRSTHTKQIDAEAACAVYDGGICRIILHLDGISNLIGSACDIQNTGIGFPVDCIFDCWKIHCVAIIVTFRFVQGNDDRICFHKAF